MDCASFGTQFDQPVGDRKLAVARHGSMKLAAVLALLLVANLASAQSYYGNNGLVFAGSPGMMPQGFNPYLRSAPPGYGTQPGYGAQPGYGVQPAGYMPMPPGQMIADEDYTEPAVVETDYIPHEANGCAACNECCCKCGPFQACPAHRGDAWGDDCARDCGHPGRPWRPWRTGQYGPGVISVINACQPLYFTVEAVFMKRENYGYSVPAGTFPNVPDLRYPNAAMPLVTAGYLFPDTSAVEATYFGWWWDQALLNQSIASGTFGAVTAPATLTGTYTSRIQSAEVNYFLPYTCTKLGTIAWLAGFRYIGYDELLDATISNGVTTQNYAVNTVNALLGGQIGGRYRANIDLWGFDGFMKIGGYNNAGQDRTTVRINGVPTGTNGTLLSSNRGALAAEAAAYLTYRFSGAGQFRVGYRMLYLDGIVAAPNQVSFTASGTILDFNASVMMHGPAVGLDLQF